LTIPGADSIANSLNYPEVISICPGGRIQVGSGFLLISFDLVGNNYQFADAEYWQRGKQMMCINDSSYMIVNTYQNNFTLWNVGFPVFFQSFPKYASIWPYDLRWLNDLISIKVHGYDEGDSLFLLSTDGHWSNRFGFAEGFDNFTVDTTAHTAYFFSGGNHYLEGGFLGSAHLETGAGPQYHDVEITNVEPGPYSDVVWKLYYGGVYYYRIPSTHVTITNHSQYLLDELTMSTNGPYTICMDTNVLKTISGLQIQSGETKTIEVHDLFAWRDYREEKSYMCVYAMAPNHHRDDDFSNNRFCFETELFPIQPPDPVMTIEHYPVIIRDDVSFFSPQPMLFNLEIFDMKGMIQFEGELDTYSNNMVNCSGFTPGMYLFRFSLPESNAVFTERILKI
jgi:hypothetical protein